MSVLGLCSNSGRATANEVNFPHPPIALSVFLTLEAAVAEAWRRIHDKPRPSFDPVTALETAFTAEIEEVLRDELLEEESVPGFTKEVFPDVVRPEVKNYDGKKVSKRPDMLVKLAGRGEVKPTQDGIFIEAKLMEKAAAAKSLYCVNGITRFNVGDYAWAMTQAMMLAYCRDNETPSTALASSFVSRKALIHTIGRLKNCASSTAFPVVAISRHRRTFKLKGRQASPITIRHLWLWRPSI